MTFDPITTTKTCTYSLGDGFRLDIVRMLDDDGDICHELWLYHKDYCVKSYLGVSYAGDDATPEEHFCAHRYPLSKVTNRLLDKEIEEYREEYMK